MQHVRRRRRGAGRRSSATRSGARSRSTSPAGARTRLRWDRAGRLVERRRGDLALRWGYDEDGAARVRRLPRRLTRPTTATTPAACSRPAAIRRPARSRSSATPPGRIVGARGAGLRRALGATRTATSSATRSAAPPLGAADARRRRPRRRGRDRRRRSSASPTTPPGSSSAAGDALVRLRRRRPARRASARRRRRRLRARRGRASWSRAGADGGAATVFEYDGAGRRVREHGDGLERAYRWDALGRLVAVEDASTSRARRSTRSASSPRSTAPALLWDTADPLAPLAWMGDRAVIGHGQPWATARDGEAEWLAPDWQGTIGAPARPVRRAARARPTRACALGYRGELEFAGETWLRARAYDPSTRGFLSPDPLPAGARARRTPPTPTTTPATTRSATPTRSACARSPTRSCARSATGWARTSSRATRTGSSRGALIVGGVASWRTGVGGPLGAAMIGGALLSAGASAGDPEGHDRQRQLHAKSRSPASSAAPPAARAATSPARAALATDEPRVMRGAVAGGAESFARRRRQPRHPRAQPVRPGRHGQRPAARRRHRRRRRAARARQA